MKASKHVIGSDYCDQFGPVLVFIQWVVASMMV